MSSLFGSKKKKQKLRERSDESTRVSGLVKGENHDSITNSVEAINKTEPVSSLNEPKDNNPQIITQFSDLGLTPQLVKACQELGFKKPTPVQRKVIPAILQGKGQNHVLALAATGSGKTAAFSLPILHQLSMDPYGIFAVILTPTRELAKQVNEQIVALGSAFKVTTALVTGGVDQVRQSCELARFPHFCIATPGRLALLLRSAAPPRLTNIRFIVIDEADRLLTSNSGFERDMAEILLAVHGGSSEKGEASQGSGRICQTLLFSATMTKSLEEMSRLAAGNRGRLTLQQIVVTEHDHNIDSIPISQDESKQDTPYALLTTPRIPAGLRQEYIFMPSRVRDTYLVSTIRLLLSNAGQTKLDAILDPKKKKFGKKYPSKTNSKDNDSDSDSEYSSQPKARSAIIFVSTCERTGYVSQLLTELGIDCIALHSLLTQNRRLASLAKFKSQQSPILVATDVASRGLDIPTVDLVINAELPRKPTDYIHRVGRTARVGRRGRAISLVSEQDIDLVHAVEKASGRELGKCEEITEDIAVKLLGPVAKAGRLAKMKLMEVGFDELVKQQKERKARERHARNKAERAARKALRKRENASGAKSGEKRKLEN